MITLLLIVIAYLLYKIAFPFAGINRTIKKAEKIELERAIVKQRSFKEYLAIVKPRRNISITKADCLVVIVFITFCSTTILLS